MKPKTVTFHPPLRPPMDHNLQSSYLEGARRLREPLLLGHLQRLMLPSGKDPIEPSRLSHHH